MRPSRLELTVPPGAEPVLLADAKEDSRVTDTSEDAVLTRFIVEARENCEGITHRRLITQTWKAYFDGFGPLASCWPPTVRHVAFATQALVLSDLTPVQDITSITYIDSGGVQQTLAADQYQLVKREPARIVPAYGVSWPSTRAVPEAVVVTVICGYGADGSTVPESLKSWIRATVGARFRFREAQNDRPPSSVAFIRSLLDKYVVRDL